MLVPKWAVTKKFKDYLLGSQFTAYTDNNPLAYIKESKLGVAQIRWLSKLALFDFDIKYRMGKSNQAADPLSHCPKASVDMSSDRGSEEEYETILFNSITDLIWIHGLSFCVVCEHGKDVGGICSGACLLESRVNYLY